MLNLYVFHSAYEVDNVPGITIPQSRVALRHPFPSTESVRTFVRTGQEYTDVRTKIARIDSRLPKCLTNGAPLARQSSAIKSYSMYNMSASKDISKKLI